MLEVALSHCLGCFMNLVLYTHKKMVIMVSSSHWSFTFCSRTYIHMHTDSHYMMVASFTFLDFVSFKSFKLSNRSNLMDFKIHIENPSEKNSSHEKIFNQAIRMEAKKLETKQRDVQ